MNRLEAPALPPTSVPTQPSATELIDGALAAGGVGAEGLFSTDGFASSLAGATRGGVDPTLTELPLATFAPVHYEPGYAYPLVVWLHGAEQSERDLASVMAHVSTRNYVAVAPASADRPWVDDAEGIADTERRVFEAIDAGADRFNVHQQRVFLAGSGCGGTAALRLALAYPDAFAGAASFDGPTPRGNTPFRRLNAVRGLPLMLATGSESRRYAEADVCHDLRLLYSAGCTLNLRQEPGDGELTTGMLAELDRWMMAIVCGK